jgi:hypothetical protein
MAFAGIWQTLVWPAQRFDCEAGAVGCISALLDLLEAIPIRSYRSKCAQVSSKNQANDAGIGRGMTAGFWLPAAHRHHGFSFDHVSSLGCTAGKDYGG